MAEIVNLRQRRKAVAKAAATAQATANAAKFGRTKAEKAREALEADRASAALEGKRLAADGAADKGEET